MLTSRTAYRSGTLGLAALLTACTTASVGSLDPPTAMTGGGAKMGPSSAESLADQQSEHGWGASRCPATPNGVTAGYGIGQQLDALVLRDCQDQPVALDAVCGADAAWLFFAHGWCPHCKLGAQLAEGLHDSFGAANLATVHVLVETSAGAAPDASSCQAWRQAAGHEEVITLYDPDGRTDQLWEQNYTALSLVLDAERVVRDKLHTDDEDLLKTAIESALPP